MIWFIRILNLIDVVASEIPNFLDNLYKFLFGTISYGYINSGLDAFFDDIPLLGEVVNAIVKWLLSGFGHISLISFILGYGIGFIIFAIFIKWILGFVKK